MENRVNSNKHSKQLARLLKQQARLKLKQRQELMSRKIELGELVIQAKLDHYPNETLDSLFRQIAKNNLNLKQLSNN